MLANQLTGNTDEDADEGDPKNLLNIDVTPSTGVLYGRVTDQNGAPAEGVTVDVNGQQAETDEFGRYIVDGFSKKGPPARNPITVTASGAGYKDEELEYDAEEKEKHRPQRFRGEHAGGVPLQRQPHWGLRHDQRHRNAIRHLRRDCGCADRRGRAAQPEREIELQKGRRMTSTRRAPTAPTQ